MRALLFIVCIVLVGCLGSSVHAAPAPLATLEQAHHFQAEVLDTSDSILLYGVFPVMLAANAAVIVGNIVTLAGGKHRQAWGGVGIVLGTITLLGGLPLVADEGVGWWVVPVSVATTVLALSITNVVLGDRRAQVAPQPKRATSGVPSAPTNTLVTLGRW